MIAALLDVLELAAALAAILVLGVIVRLSFGVRSMRAPWRPE